ncbi:U-box domain-containing protein 52-like [Citrus sinensis]|uniref:U-box domain-containing protein 52-like n=1 Tax=Citrus sinensis TaxID=2711 RepID=UPI002278CB86|nr:U-box domain-containing protein 52-like [Citrus sinensis]
MTLVKSFSKTKKSSANAITAVAIDADKSSQYAVKWAVDNLLNESSQYVLLHVRNHSSNPQELEASSIGGRPATNDELQKLFLPYRGLFARKRILAREVVLQDIDVSSALIYYVKNNSVGNIVAGGSSRNLLTRKFRNLDLPSSLLKSAPESCAVYIISSKGKLQSSRPAASQPQMLSGDALIPKQPPLGERPSVIQPDSPRSVEIGRSDYSCDSSISKVTDRNYSSTDNSQKAKNGKSESTFPIVSSILPADSHMQNSFNSESESDISDFSVPVSYQSTEISENIDFSSLSKSSKDHFPQSPKGLEAEIKRLRLELKQSMEIYNSVSKEAVSTSQTAVKLQQRKKEEALKLEARLAEEAALALVKSERQKTRAAMEAALMAQRLVELEAMKREIAELKAMQEEEEKKIVMEAMAYKNVRYRKYTIEEIEAATDYFSISRKIGEGGYGPVYKAQLDHTSVAIKVLGPDISQGPRQFKQEVEILGSMRHTNMVILLGACPEYGCLVYEYMENGSLEDRLFQKDNSPPIHWSIRFKIAAEIATALLFLHQNKPEPLVHRDLKPANILLDQNYVSKISDVGLARLVPPSAADTITQYHMTTAAGTFCYIDPEYQQTGMLGVKSDLYSLGVVLLQLITARPAMGLSHQVEQAIRNGTFSELLDPTVTGWPVEAALSIAKLALQCCELRKRDRPDLVSVVLPELIRLRDLGFENAENKNDNIVVTPGPYNSVSEMKQEGMRNNPNVEMQIQRRSIYEADGSGLSQ